MSYLVLARKYRSRDFESLVGQEHVVQALSNALTHQRLHHAYLFTGTRGVGKTSVSRILAKALNCTGPDGQGGITATPCGVCDACRDIDSGRFVDYVELDAASNRGVEEISQLLDQAVYKPVMGRFKVYMIDEVHMLSNTAFNAMLKTLEEPPEYLKFVLATTDPQKVPPTVLSRCLQFNLRPMAPQTVQTHLASVLVAEKIEAEPGALRLLSRAARGSMRDALSLTDQAIAFGAGSLSEAGVRQMLGAVDRTHAVRLIEALSAGDGAGVVNAVNELRGLGLSASGTLEELAALLQQMAVLQAVPDALDESDPDAPAVARLSGLLAADETQLLYSIVLHGRAELGLAPDEYSGLVMVLLRMLAFRPAGAPRTPAPPRPDGAGTGSAGHGGGASAGGSRPGPAAASGSVGATGVAAAPVLATASARAAEPVVSQAPAAVASAPVAAPVPSAPAASTAARPSVSAPMMPPPAAPSMPRDVARPAVVAAAPVARVPARSEEPPAWADEPIWDDEVPSEASPAPAFERGAEPVFDRDEPMATPSARTLRASSPSAPASLPVGPSLMPTVQGERWAAVVGEMVAAGSISALTRELAMQAECLGIDTQGARAVWKLRVERETLRAPSQRDKLQAALGALLQQEVVLEIESGVATDSPALRANAERVRRQADAEHLIHNDPDVLALMQQFKTARIVPGSVKFH